MTQSRVPQTNLPKVLNNFEALKALSKRILKLYIILRKKDWDSYKGQAKSYLKLAVAVASFGKYGSAELDTWRILNDCDEIKKEIEGASRYPDLVNLINKLNEKAIHAINEELPGISKPSLRAHTYYAIISLIQEMMKVQFPEEYAADVQETLARLEDEKHECQRRYDSGLSPEESYKNIDALLPKLVLLGVREIYHDAFGQNRNLFPHFKHIAGTSYVSQSDVSLYAQWIKTQRRQETGSTGVLTGYQLPNPNIPYHLQPNFALIYLKKEHEETLESCANLAIKDPIIRSDRTFYTQYVADPKTFTAKNDPADATEIMAEEENTHESSPTTDLNDGIDHEAVEANGNTGDESLVRPAEGALPPADNKQESDIPTTPPANVNVVPLVPAAPPSPKASQLGKFATPPSPKDESKSPAPKPAVQEQSEEMEETETQSASDEEQKRTAHHRRSKRR